MKPARQRVLVAGAGAIGQFVGGRLGEAGHHVTLLTTQRHLDAFARDGLCVRGLSNLCWTPTAVTSVPELADASTAQPFDAILVTAKAYRTAELAQGTAPLLAPDGVMVTLQNGLGNAEKLAHAVAPDRIAVATTSVGITLDEPGHLTHAGDGATHVGPWRAAGHAAARRAQALLTDAALAPTWHDEMRPLVWQKALLNAAINPVGALHGVANGAILDDEALRSLSLGLLAEGEALATRARVSLPSLRPVLLDVLGRTRANRNSMLQDVEARRPTETEQILGRLVRLGEQLLASMPRMDSVYGRMKDLESSYLGAEAATKLAWDELAWSRDPV